MLQFTANLTMLFNEVGFLDRFALAAKAGFKGAEFKDPFSYKKEDVVAALKNSGLQAVLFNMPADQAVEIIRDVGAENLGIEYDVYQAQLMEGDLTKIRSSGKRTMLVDWTVAGK